ncbi:hypothetical protein GGR57DRAFT_507028 [Xylariaceae sp. FL1272]|nr:hypothetical protein GGR57DRAFT_507028 [Xylariaceae sp. FL1272]
MALSPPSLIRSPASSRNSRSPGLDYPSPDLADCYYKIGPAYEPACGVASSTMEPSHSLPHHDTTTSAEWVENTLIQSVPPAGGPGMLSSDYGPYVSYDSVMHAPYSHDMYSTHMAHAHTLTNTPSNLASIPSRSPDPLSSRHSVSYHSVSPIPRVKMEHDYASGADQSQYPSPRSGHAMLLESSSYGSQAGSTGYLSDAASGSWAKSSDYQHLESDPYYSGAGGSGSSLSTDRRSSTTRLPRAPKRQPRKLTSKEEANFQCEVEGCGKLFSRSYNYKAHMETHDKRREYPFPCTVDDCTKKFVRKTDLQRHHQSVHAKEKNHKCDYCGRLFARKDTLRRHMEDGCSKRFDIGTLDLRGEGYDAMRPLPGAAGHTMSSSTQLPPMTIPRSLGHSDEYTTSVHHYAKR